MLCGFLWRVVWLSELVSTLWFEDVGFIHEPILDTPLGRFSIRQTIIFLVFGLLVWVGSLIFADLALKIVAAGTIFFSGAAIFTRKIKTLPPEVHLFYLITNRSLQKPQKPPTNPKPIEPSTQSMFLSATLGVPLKVVGVLKDPTTDQILSNKPFNVNLDNTLYTKGLTDKDGFFCTYIVPDRFGLFQITLQPEDAHEPFQQITLNVNPKTEVSQPAETKTNP